LGGTTRWNMMTPEKQAAFIRRMVVANKIRRSDPNRWIEMTKDERRTAVDEYLAANQ